ncbi:MFS transporter [Dyella silvatica]|uniref:MFS transporter n=1 Tax=Dyella silvatica TaxID=2992128 RepID=UPI0022512C26|nr:MFS transporter [Dyella silvatica]
MQPPPRHPPIVAKVEQAATQLTAPLTALFAFAVCVIIINLTAAQPLTGPVSRSLHLPVSLSGLVAMLPQLGYAVGMLFLVPLADLLENRRLTVTTLACCALMLALAASAATAPWFLLAVCLAGATSCAIQILVPLAAAMAHPDRRGSAVGNVMSGVMLGILLSRPFASLIEGAFGWRAFYGVLAALDALLALALWRWLPLRHPGSGETYRGLIASLGTLWRREKVLRRYAYSAAVVMAGFSAFWTGIGLRLVQAPFSLDSHGMALFALAGVAGTIVAPLAGKIGDRGHSATAMPVAHLLLLIGVLLAGSAGAGWFGMPIAEHPQLALGLLVIAAILLDAGAVGDQTLGRRAINMLDPNARSRLNGLFVGVFFVGGGIGAVAAGTAWAIAGWGGVCALCLALCALAFVGDLLARARH